MSSDADKQDVETSFSVYYIGGSGRSGSTLLDRKLSTLNGVLGVGEVCHFKRYALENLECSCAHPIGHCTLWSGVYKELVKNYGESLDGLDLLYETLGLWGKISVTVRVAMSRSLNLRADLASSYDGLYQSINSAVKEVDRENGRLTIVNSTKNPLLLYHLTQQKSHTIRLIHLVRNPAGVVYSRSVRGGQPIKNGKSRPSILASTLTWIKWNWIIERLRRQLPVENSICIRYEDLVEKDPATLKKLLEFMGIDATLNIDFMEQFSDGELHTIAGNRMKSDTTKNRELRVDETWKNQLGGWSKLLIATLTWRFRKRYNYKIW